MLVTPVSYILCWSFLAFPENCKSLLDLGSARRSGDTTDSDSTNFRPKQHDQNLSEPTDGYHFSRPRSAISGPSMAGETWI